jgi:proteasome lid subunit RPN8/RPN11
VSLPRFLLSDALRERVLREARVAFPREGCGLIEGLRDGAELHATAIHPVANLADEPDRFELDPAKHIALLRELRGTGRQILGCYHSHPKGRAEPSARDRAGAFEDGFLWLIAAVDGEGRSELNAYCAARGNFEVLEIAYTMEIPFPQRGRGIAYGDFWLAGFV